MPQNQEPLLVPPEEAARILGVDKVSSSPRQAVLRLARNGELRSVRVGRWTMIALESVRRLAEGR